MTAEKPFLFLVGMMGVGKSTVGALLAARIGKPFVDLDAVIEMADNATISELFAAGGEPAFRERESAVLQQVIGGEPAVVATGGGAPAHGDNLGRMRAVGSVVWLQAATDALLTRIGDIASRPLLARAANPAAELNRLAAARERFYRQADLAIDTTTVAPSQVATRIIKELGLTA